MTTKDKKKFYKGQIVFVDRGFGIYTAGYYKCYREETKDNRYGGHVIVFDKKDLKREHRHSLICGTTRGIYEQTKTFMDLESDTSFIKGFKVYNKRRLLTETIWGY